MNFKIGDKVSSKKLSSNASNYDIAVIVSVEPFIVMSLDGSKQWNTKTATEFAYIGSTDNKSLASCYKSLLRNIESANDTERDLLQKIANTFFDSIAPKPLAIVSSHTEPPFFLHHIFGEYETWVFDKKYALEQTVEEAEQFIKQRDFSMSLKVVTKQW